MRIRLSRLFSYKTENLLEYLEEKHSTKVKNQFLKKLYEKIETLKTHPKAYPKSDKKRELRKLVISKQTTVLYKLTEDSVFIITLIDNRQNPNKIEEEIKKHFG